MCPSPPGRTRCPSPSTWPSSSPLASLETSSPCSPSLMLGSTTNGAFLGCLPDFLVFCCRCKYCHHHHHHHHYDHLVFKGAHFDHCPHPPLSIVRSPLLHHRHALPDVHLCQRFLEVNQSCDNMVSIFASQLLEHLMQLGCVDSKLGGVRGYDHHGCHRSCPLPIYYLQPGI